MRSLKPRVTGVHITTVFRFVVAAAMVAGSLVIFDAPAGAATAPGAPVIGTAVAGPASATVTWTAPVSNGGSPITGYAVTPFIGFFPLPTVVFNSVATTQVVTGLTGGTVYRFRVAAINAIGTGPMSTTSNPVTPFAVVPGAPTIGTAVPGNAEVTLSWTAPVSNGGSPITGYAVTPFIGFFPLPAVVFNSVATTQTVTGLTNGTSYRFKVAAINAVGTGPMSLNSNPAVIPATVPDAPTIGLAVRGNAEVTLSWTAGFDGGRPITSYTVTPYIALVAQTPVVFNSLATTQTITGLTNGTTYTFTVAATNVLGTGAESAQSNAVKPATVPDAPTIGTATGGNAEATLSWTAPAWDGGEPVTGYSVTPYIGASPQTPVVFNSPSTSQTITGLTNGTTYTFTVAAINVVGTGASSAASNAVTPMTVPAAPTIGSVTNGNGQVSVFWTPPVDDGGSPVTGYTITPYIGVTPQTPVTYNSNASTQTVLGLTNGTTYTFTVAAINVVGTGAPSAATVPVTPVITAVGEGGGSHSCALLPGTDVACWGLNSSGQLGDGTTTNRTSPVGVGGLLNGSSIALGDSHTCALLTDGTVSCWGSNSFGQLGDGTTTSRLTPAPVSGLTGVTAISSSKYHTCALLNTGTVKCWGYNVHGELGDGTATSRRLPAAVSGLTGVSAITTGSWHTCALASGVVKCWGSNTRGQLGDGTIIERRTPVSVVGLPAATSVVALGSSTCAITSGTVRCWGLNHHGQLGNNSVANRQTTPVSVVGLSGVTQLAGGLYHACALLTDGTVKCWGYATYGNLGNASPTERHTPVSVIGLSGVVSIAAGANHNLARLATGAVRAWGANAAGQLGDTTTTNRTTPVPTSTLG